MKYECSTDIYQMNAILTKRKLMGIEFESHESAAWETKHLNCRFDQGYSAQEAKRGRLPVK